MNSTISERQKQFIDEIAIKDGFKYYKVTFDQGSLKGDGYLGTITIVKIKETLTDKVLHLILKSAEPGEELRQIIPIHQAYHREIYMYEVIFKEFSNLQKEQKVKKTFDGTAKYYGGLKDFTDECLALQNMKETGYKLWDRKKPMDSHHVGAVMSQYGKFHALSYALKKLKPERYQELTKTLVDINEGNITDEEMHDSTINIIDTAFKAVRENMAAVAGLKRFLESSKVFFKQTLQVKDRFSVITHGDSWCNNILFQYEELSSKTPSKVCLLDWQLSRTGSPIQDISYFFYTCSSKLCIDNHNSYLKIYHDSLDEMLKQFGIKVKEIMTFNQLQVQWLIYAKYGMYMALLMIKIMLTEENECPDLKDVSNGNKSVMDLFEIDISNMAEYNKRISVVINHMVKNRFI